MAPSSFIDACFFKNFAETSCLGVFDCIFSGRAHTGFMVQRELKIRHSADIGGRLYLVDMDAAQLVPAIQSCRMQKPALSEADAELIALAQLHDASVFSDEKAVYELCGALSIPCNRLVGVLRSSVDGGIVTPDAAITMLERIKLVKPPRRIPEEIIACALSDWRRRIGEEA